MAVEKDYITINKNDGTTETMEIVLITKSREFNKNYIIYKTLDGKHYFCASFTGSINNKIVNCDFNHNLSDQEKDFLNDLLNTFPVGEK